MTDHGVWDSEDTKNFFNFFKALINFLQNPASSKLCQAVLQLGNEIGSIGEYAYPIRLDKGLSDRLDRLLAGDKAEWAKWLWSVWVFRQITCKLKLLSPFSRSRLIFVKTHRVPSHDHLEVYSSDFPAKFLRKWESRIKQLPIFDVKYQKWAIVISSINLLEEKVLLEK